MAEKIDLVVKSKIKSVVKELNVASDVAESLNGAILSEIAKAAARAQANGRRTLQARDILIQQGKSKGS